MAEYTAVALQTVAAGADIALIILTLSIWTMGFLLKDIEKFEE